MLDFVVLNIGYHRSLHLEGDHTAAPAAQFVDVVPLGALVGRLAGRTRSHGGGAICISSSALAVQPPCRPPKQHITGRCHSGSALFTTASSPGHPRKETQFKNSR